MAVHRGTDGRFVRTRSGPPSRPCSPTIRVCSDAAARSTRSAPGRGDAGDGRSPSAEAYARSWWNDPSLIPMLTRDVSGLRRTMFRSLYATAGTDAAKAAEHGQGLPRRHGAAGGPVRPAGEDGGAFAAGRRPERHRGAEGMRSWSASAATSGACWKSAVALASAAAPAIGAALGLLVSWGGQLAGLLGTLDADLVAGIGKGIAAFMALRGAVGAADDRVRQPQGSVGAADGSLFRQPLPPRHRSRRNARGGRHGQLGRGQGVPPRRLGRRGVRRAGRRGCGGVGLR